MEELYLYSYCVQTLSCSRYTIKLYILWDIIFILRVRAQSKSHRRHVVSAEKLNHMSCRLAGCLPQQTIRLKTGPHKCSCNSKLLFADPLQLRGPPTCPGEIMSSMKLVAVRVYFRREIDYCFLQDEYYNTGCLSTPWSKTLFVNSPLFVNIFQILYHFKNTKANLCLYWYF